MSSSFECNSTTFFVALAPYVNINVKALTMVTCFGPGRKNPGSVTYYMVSSSGNTKHVYISHPVIEKL